MQAARKRQQEGIVYLRQIKGQSASEFILLDNQTAFDLPGFGASLKSTIRQQEPASTYNSASTFESKCSRVQLSVTFDRYQGLRQISGGGGFLIFF